MGKRINFPKKRIQSIAKPAIARMAMKRSASAFDLSGTRKPHGEIGTFMKSLSPQLKQFKPPKSRWYGGGKG